MTEQASLRAIRSAEARLLARRAGAADPDAAVAAALEAVGGDALPPEFAATGRAIAEAVEAHGAQFETGAEPAYHDRHHQAEATLCAGWLAAAALRAGLLGRREAGILVLAMAGHDLLHDGTVGDAPGALERRSAGIAERLAAPLAAADRVEIVRLILATAPDAAPGDIVARMAREADLFASLTPDLGWRLSHALAAERRAARLPGADEIASHAGRCALLGKLPPMTPPAVSLGLEAVRQLQIAALCRAGDAASAAEGAERLDAMPPAEAAWRWSEALAALGLPELQL
jgi:predicted metal-dependent HD superfamily phosphohydrolase